MPEITHRSGSRPSRLGPYSKRLRRGAIGDSVDGRSALGRFIRDLEAQLIAHCGGSPTVPQRMLIDRMIRLRVQLDLLDAKVGSPDWTPHDSRTYSGMLNAYRLCARDLGPPASARPPTPAEALAAVHAAMAGGMEADDAATA
jgi:hypothetical protein